LAHALRTGSIARSLSLLVAAVTVLVTALSLGGLLALSQRRYDESLERRGHSLLGFLEESLRIPLWSLDEEAAASIGAATARDELVSRLEVLDHRGRVYFRVEKDEPVAFELQRTVRHQGGAIGELRLSVSGAPRRRFLGSLAAVAGVTGVLAVALQLLLIGPLLRQKLRAPFSALNATIQAYEQGRYDAPPHAVAFAEFAPVSALLARMGRTVDRQLFELGAAEEKYRRVFDTARVGIFRATPEGRLLDVNPAWLALLGYESRDELLAGVPDATQLYADHADRAAILASLRRDERVTRREVRLRRKDGRLVWAAITAVPVFDEQGRLAAIEGLVDDVTEQKRMQELLVQTEKMTSLGGLAAGMAHELNNPLGIVLQSLENVERRCSAALPANQAAAREAGLELAALGRYMDARGISGYLAAMRQAAERAAAIIRAMLEFSRARDSQAGPCSLAAVVESALELAANDYDLRRKFDFRAVRVTRELDAATPDVACSAGEMVQVVLNVVKNAAEALADAPPRDGPPTIGVELRPDGRYARLEIRDNGPGMDEPTRVRVFEPYFSTKRPGEGTGLGLSVAYFIVTQRHGGTITVESSPGRGSCFVIRLPVAGPADATAAG
jgi:PAS domain S-box-containing protein